MKKLIYKICFVSILLIILFGNFTITYSAERRTTHFLIDYVSMTETPVSDRATEEYIDNVRTIAEQVWTYVITNQGYQRPPNVPETPANDNEKVRINVRNIIGYGFTSEDEESPNYRPIITIDNDYSTHNISGLNGLCITLIHEFFHAVQQSYAHADVYNPTTLDWFWEGTAAWIEDESVTLAGVNIDTINSYILDNYAKIYLSRPEVSLDDISRDYDNVLFFKYLTEQGYSIKKILENYDAGNYTTANNDDMLRAIGQALGALAPDYFGNNFKTLYKNFSLACYMKTGEYGFKDDGASQLSDVAQVSPADITDDYYIDTFDEASKKIIPKERTLNHLAANYVPINKPATLTEKTTIYIFADGETDTDWGFWAVKVKKVKNETEVQNV